MPFAPRAGDELTELLDPRPLLLDPFLDARIEHRAAAARQELDPELLEIARQAGGQQPLPLVGRDEAGDLLLRPVEPERFAEPGVGAGQRQLVDFLAGGERGDSEYSVELVQADQAAHDLVACAERDQAVAASGGFVADFGANELGRGDRNLAHPRLQHRAQLRHANLAAGGAQHVGEVRADGRGGDREQLDTHGFGEVGFLHLHPQLVEVEQSLGDEERGDDLLERGAFLLRQVERGARAEPVDQPVGDLGADDLVAQAVGADRVGVGLAHRLGKGVEQFGTDQRILGQPQLLGRVLQHELGNRQHDRELGPGQAATFLHPAQQHLARVEPFDLAVEPARDFEQLDRPDVRGEHGRPARLGDRQRQRLEPVVLEHQFGDLIGHLREQGVALVERQLALAHLAVERDLDVHFIVGAVDARAVVDEVGVDPPAVVGELDPTGLGDGQIGALADDLGANLGAVGAQRIVRRIADLRLALGGGFDVGSDAAEPQQVDRRLEDRIDQRGRIQLLVLDSERGARFRAQPDRFLGPREHSAAG